MKTIQTKYGAMHLYDNLDELEAFDYGDCVRWLQFNDHNGCYTKQEQELEFGDYASLAEMKELILVQSER